MGAGRGAGSLGYGLKPTGWQVLRFPRSAGWGQAPAVPGSATVFTRGDARLGGPSRASGQALRPGSGQVLGDSRLRGNDGLGRGPSTSSGGLASKVTSPCHPERSEGSGVVGTGLCG